VTTAVQRLEVANVSLCELSPRKELVAAFDE
jgi:hypothetical protein